MVSTSPHTPDSGYKNPDIASRSRCWLSTHLHPLQGVPANPNPTNSAQPHSLRLLCQCPEKSTALQSPNLPDWVCRTAPLYHQRAATGAGLGSYTGNCRYLNFFSKCFTILRILARAVSFFCRSITLSLLNFCVSSLLHCSVRLTQVELSADTANTTGGSGNRAARCVRL